MQVPACFPLSYAGTEHKNQDEICLTPAMRLPDNCLLTWKISDLVWLGAHQLGLEIEDNNTYHLLKNQVTAKNLSNQIKVPIDSYVPLSTPHNTPS